MLSLSSDLHSVSGSVLWKYRTPLSSKTLEKILGPGSRVGVLNRPSINLSSGYFQIDPFEAVVRDSSDTLRSSTMAVLIFPNNSASPGAAVSIRAPSNLPTGEYYLILVYKWRVTSSEELSPLAESYFSFIKKSNYNSLPKSSHQPEYNNSLYQDDTCVIASFRSTEGTLSDIVSAPLGVLGYDLFKILDDQNVYSELQFTSYVGLLADSLPAPLTGEYNPNSVLTVEQVYRAMHYSVSNRPQQSNHPDYSARSVNYSHLFYFENIVFNNGSSSKPLKIKKAVGAIC